MPIGSSAKYHFNQLFVDKELRIQEVGRVDLNDKNYRLTLSPHSSSRVSSNEPLLCSPPAPQPVLSELSPAAPSSAQSYSPLAFLSLSSTQGEELPAASYLSITLSTISLSLCIIDKEYVDKEWDCSKFLKDN